MRTDIPPPSDSDFDAAELSGNDSIVESDADSDVEEDEDGEAVAAGKKRKRKSGVTRKDITALRTTRPAKKIDKTANCQNGV